MGLELTFPHCFMNKSWSVVYYLFIHSEWCAAHIEFARMLTLLPSFWVRFPFNLDSEKIISIKWILNHQHRRFVYTLKLKMACKWNRKGSSNRWKKSIIRPGWNKRELLHSSHGYLYTKRWITYMCMCMWESIIKLQVTTKCTSHYCPYSMYKPKHEQYSTKNLKSLEKGGGLGYFLLSHVPYSSNVHKWILVDFDNCNVITLSTF